VGTVTAIDAKTQLVTVRARGNEVDIKVEDPAKLKNVKRAIWSRRPTRRRWPSRSHAGKTRRNAEVNERRAGMPG